MQTPDSHIGFIGLGAMGLPMAKRLAGAGYQVTVFDADPARAAAASAELGTAPAPTLAGLASGSDVIVTMLPSSAIVRQVLLGASNDGILSGLRKGALVLEMSSGEPEVTRELAHLVAQKGASLVDAPVSGGVSRARTGELAIMVGGETEAIERARPILSSMGTSILPTGGVGSAHAMKALNNLVSAGGFLIGIEALLIGARFGLDPAMMVDVLNVSTGMNNSTQKKFKQFVLSRKFDAGFGLDLMVKDLGIALGIARATDTTSPFAGLCRDLWAGSQKTLGSGQDHTAVARFSEMLAGTELR
ncbi:unnamed protein product [Phaeothamnion confervicola]